MIFASMKLKNCSVMPKTPFDLTNNVMGNGINSPHPSGSSTSERLSKESTKKKRKSLTIKIPPSSTQSIFLWSSILVESHIIEILYCSVRPITSGVLQESVSSIPVRIGKRPLSSNHSEAAFINLYLDLSFILKNPSN